jgi:DNA ligase-1
MNRREFLLQAHDYKQQHIAGWMVSEKCDGSRAFWDGGVTRGMLASDVPWANVEKKGHYINRAYSTGLWSRYGNVINAPEWWTEKLPDFPLDGELWAGRSLFQFTRSTVSKLIGGQEWGRIDYKVIDAPAYQSVFQDGVVNLPNYHKTFKGVVEWYEQKLNGHKVPGPFFDFESTQKFLNREIPALTLKQTQLPFTTVAAEQRLHELFQSVLDEGGEGVILRKHTSLWRPQRSHDCLKLKPMHDAEGIVIGYTSGRETDKGSKLLGLMGALIISYNGKRLELSGFTDSERRLSDPKWCAGNPGKEVPAHIHSECFPRGSIITFKYRELTDAGLPKEASFLRKRVIC